MTGDGVFEAVRAIVNGRDPEGLLEGGAPEDEYDPEVNDLVELVRGGSPVTAEQVRAIWGHWFGASSWIDGRPEELAEVAAELDDLRG
ncbi:hypothetical protein ACGFNU_00630 [Spirillospora sp. NPDC048911]|uniref:hypothetical protein n=1 Tax=Spirillospora sp. NPDC048911 TaxID=3364527 RepID=UPI00371FE65F